MVELLGDEGIFRKWGSSGMFLGHWECSGKGLWDPGLFCFLADEVSAFAPPSTPTVMCCLAKGQRQWVIESWTEPSEL
jgi:hypothetical protein